MIEISLQWKKTFTGENEPLIGQNVIAWAFGVRKNYKTFQVFFRFGQHMYLSDHLTDASIRKRMQHACGNALRFFSFVVASKKPDRCYESHDILRLLNVFKTRASERKRKRINKKVKIYSLHCWLNSDWNRNKCLFTKSSSPIIYGVHAVQNHLIQWIILRMKPLQCHWNSEQAIAQQAAIGEPGKKRSTRIKPIISSGTTNFIMLFPMTCVLWCVRDGLGRGIFRLANADSNSIWFLFETASNTFHLYTLSDWAGLSMKLDCSRTAYM